MDYNTFFISQSLKNKPVLIPTVSYHYQTIEPSIDIHNRFISSENNFNRFTTNLGVLKNNISSFLPNETSKYVWTTLVGLTFPVLCYAGFKFWKWISKIENENKTEPYEYKYIKELDDMLQTKLDDIQNPEMANVDTIRIGKFVFPLEVFKSFKRNFRKRLIRKTDDVPIVKRVPIPAEDFDWKGSYVEEYIPNNMTIDHSVANVDGSDNEIEMSKYGKRVMMRYEPETESFWWYSDSSSIQYKYLETIARKYVYDFNRLDVFIDFRDELKKGVEESKKRKRDSENGNDKTKSMNENKIYAKFKRYNKKAARTDPNVGNKMMIIKAKANRYSYKGKLCDYEKIISESNKAVEDKNDLEHVSWSEWKKINFDYWTK